MSDRKRRNIRWGDKERKKRGSGTACFKSFLTCLFLLSASSFHSSLTVFSFSLIPPSQRSDPSLSHSSLPSPPIAPPLIPVIGEASTNPGRGRAWGTAYAKWYLIFMSCYRSFKSLIRTAAQLSVPTAWPAGCVCTYSSLFLALIHTLRAHTRSLTSRTHAEPTSAGAQRLVIVLLPPSGRKDWERVKPGAEEERYKTLTHTFFLKSFTCSFFVSWRRLKWQWPEIADGFGRTPVIRVFFNALWTRVGKFYFYNLYLFFHYSTSYCHSLCMSMCEHVLVCSRGGRHHVKVVSAVR